jgi:hypothetical protein
MSLVEFGPVCVSLNKTFLKQDIIVVVLLIFIIDFYVVVCILNLLYSLPLFFNLLCHQYALYQFIVHSQSDLKLRKNDIFCQLHICFTILVAFRVASFTCGFSINFHKFELPNQDIYIYTFTQQAIFNKRRIDDMLQRAASICLKILFHQETLLPKDSDIYT